MMNLSSKSLPNCDPSPVPEPKKPVLDDLDGLGVGIPARLDVARSAAGRPDAGGRGPVSGGEKGLEAMPDRAGFDRKGTGHGMLNAGRFRNRWAVAGRHILMKLVSKLPGTRFKSRLIRRLFKVTMGEDVGLAYGVMLDPYDPSMISFGDNVIVGTESKFFVHTFMLNRQRVKPIRVGSNVQIGAFCVVAPGVTIGDGASIAPCTLISRNVAPGAVVTGNEMHIRMRK